MPSGRRFYLSKPRRRHEDYRHHLVSDSHELWVVAPPAWAFTEAGRIEGGIKGCVSRSSQFGIPELPRKTWSSSDVHADTAVGCNHGLGTYKGHCHGGCLFRRDASVYLSSGGGFIGGASHESIRKAAQKMVAIAAECQAQAHATTTYPLPERSQVIFYLLTDVGIFTANAPEEELSSHRHPLSKLGDAGQDIITQYRIIQ
jgi:hypothetical protein